MVYANIVTTRQGFYIRVKNNLDIVGERYNGTRKELSKEVKFSKYFLFLLSPVEFPILPRSRWRP